MVTRGTAPTTSAHKPFQSLEQQLKETEQRALDRDWNGEEIGHHWQTVERLRERIKRGELYEPPF